MRLINTIILLMKCIKNLEHLNPVLSSPDSYAIVVFYLYLASFKIYGTVLFYPICALLSLIIQLSFFLLCISLHSFLRFRLWILNHFSFVRSSSFEQDGGLAGPQACLPYKNKTIHILQHEDNSSGEVLDYKKQQDPWGDQGLSLSAQKSIGSTLTASLQAQLRSSWAPGGGPQGMVLPGEEENVRTTASFTAVNVCSLCHRDSLWSSPRLVPADRAAWCPTDCIYFLRLELELWLWQDPLSGVPGHCCLSGCNSTFQSLWDWNWHCYVTQPHPTPGPLLPSWAFVLPWPGQPVMLWAPPRLWL